MVIIIHNNFKNILRIFIAINFIQFRLRYSITIAPFFFSANKRSKRVEKGQKRQNVAFLITFTFCQVKKDDKMTKVSEKKESPSENGPRKDYV